MDKKFLDDVADKLENVQFLSAELDKTHGHDVDGVKADYEEACADLERLLFDWVAGQTQDPEPDKPEKSSDFYRAVAQRADEIAVLLADISDELTQCAKEWRNY